MSLGLPSSAVGICSCPVSRSYYVALRNHVICTISFGSENEAKLARFAGVEGSRDIRDGHRLISARFDLDQATGLCVTRAQSVYIAAGGEHAVRLISGDNVSRVAGPGQRYNASNNRPCFPRFHLEQLSVNLHAKFGPVAREKMLY
jgi:hypothetical protein